MHNPRHRFFFRCAVYYDPVWFGGSIPRTRSAIAPQHGRPDGGCPCLCTRRTPLSVLARTATTWLPTTPPGPLHLGAGFSKVGDNWQAALRGLYTIRSSDSGIAYYQRNKGRQSQITGTGAGSRNNFRLSTIHHGRFEFHANGSRQQVEPYCWPAATRLDSGQLQPEASAPRCMATTPR